MQPVLFYWRGSGEVRSDVLAALRAVGYELKVILSFEEILDLSQRRKPDLIVVDASAGESEASVRVVELSGAQVLTTVPIVFVSYQAENRSKVLKRQFANFLPVDIPFSLPRFIEQLQTLCPSRPELVQDESPSADVGLSESIELDEKSVFEPIVADPASAPAGTSDSKVDLKPPPGSRSRLLRVDALSEETLSAIAHRNKLIQNHDPAQLTSGYGGATYCQAATVGSLDDNLLLPDLAYREVLVRALAEMTEKNVWLGQHARRVAYVSSAISNSLGATSDRDMRLRAAAMLLNWGLRDKGQLMPAVDLFFPENIVLIPRIVDGFRLSAQFVETQLGDSETANIISEIATILDSHSKDLPASTGDGSAILAIELTDRAIWGNGKWDPFGAHRALRRLHEGTPIRVHRPIKNAVGRVLSEAASTRQFTKNYFPDAENGSEDAARQSELEAARSKAEEEFSQRQKMNVQVFDLQPGMLLARPVESWDGSVIVHANIVLDEDMIDHIWRLATIRPIRPPLVITAPSEQPAEVTL